MTLIRHSLRLCASVLTLAAVLALTSCDSIWLSLYRARGGGYGAGAHSSSLTPHRSSLKQPLLIPVLYEGEERYQSLEPWSFVRAGLTETIPAGVIVDGASVPRTVWSFMPPDGLHRAAAFAHDWSYGKKGHLDNGLVLSRLETDQMFYDFMIDAGVSSWRASTAYNAVRLGGWKPWADPAGHVVIAPLAPRVFPLRVSAPPSLFRPRHLYATP